jgi:hypothetical protein
LRKSLNSKDVIGSTARFPATMHGKDGIAHIDTSQRNRRSQDISQCAASSNVGVIDKSLTGNTCLSADLSKYGS